MTAVTLPYQGTSADTLLTTGPRYGYVAITNTGTEVMYASATPGVDPSDSAGVAIMPGETTLLANGNAYWSQAERNLLPGVIETATPSIPSSPANPGHVTYGRSLAGGVADDGTTIAIAATGTFLISAAG